MSSEMIVCQRNVKKPAAKVTRVENKSIVGIFMDVDGIYERNQRFIQWGKFQKNNVNNRLTKTLQSFKKIYFCSN